MVERRQTALGAARARFIEGLPRKAREVRASLALLTGTPAEDRPREELRRRLHALYASAQVFRIEALAEALKGALEAVDLVRAERRGFEQAEIDGLARVAASIPKLGGDPSSESPTVTGMSSPGITPAEAELIAAPAARTNKKPRMTHGYDAVVSVLLVEHLEEQARVRAALPPERFELMIASDADEALRLARSGAPDVVLADPSLIGPGTHLVERLRDDPLTDFVPVVLLLPPGSPLDPIRVRESGADEALVKPFDAAALLRTISRVTDTLTGSAGASAITGDMTVEEIANYLGEEVKRGLVEAAAQGKDIAIPLGDGTPVLAAVWSAIGRVRAHLAERSGGRVRFRENPGRGGPAFVSVSGDGDADADGITVDLAGRRVVVVDDDPAVVWFFAGLLREHGADVVEAGDGIEALEAARARRPDLIISDILMPRLDGFGLTRALGRDPTLSDVPVILISWKEDFLSRMRELSAGAKGYLRKEAGTAQILAAVRDALVPRARLEQRLRVGGDVRGRLEDVGMHTLLTTVAEQRPDARVTIRDAGSLFEAELRDGDLVDITRTASDGMFARGRPVLRAALGTGTARYTVADADGAVRRSITRPLAQALHEEMADLAAHVDAVSGKNLSKAARVVLHEDSVAAIVRSSPEQVERVVEAIREGRGPRQLLVQGEIDPRGLEEVLVDLAKKGAISDVRGVDGSDRVALAKAARDEGLNPALSEHEEKGTLSWLPPPAARQAIRDQAARDRASDLVSELVDDAASRDQPELALIAPGSRALAAPALPRAPRLLDAPTLIDEDELDQDELESLRPPPSILSESESEPPPLDEPFAEALDLDGGAAGDSSDLGPSGRRAALDDGGAHAELAFDSSEVTLDVQRDELKREVFERALESTEDPDVEATELAEEELEALADLDDDELEGGATLRLPPSVAMVEDEAEELAATPMRVDSVSPPETPEGKDDARRTAPRPKKKKKKKRKPTPETRSARDERETLPTPKPADPQTEGGMGLLAWALVVLALGALGFVGWRLTHPSDVAPEPAGPEAPPERVRRTTGASAPEPSRPNPNRAESTESDAEEPTDPTLDAPATWGRDEEGLALPDVAVASGEGLVVIEPAASSLRVQWGEVEMRVDETPVGFAAPEGVHHLTVIRGDNHDFIWVAVRAGHTRFVPPLP